MAAETEIIRQKLTQLLTQDPYLLRVFPSAGNIERAKLSRARLLLKNARDNNVDLSSAVEAAIAIEVIHLATLVHDDVIDDSPMRRNAASFKASHGNKSAVLYGDYLFSLGVNHVQATQNAACASVFTECIHDTCRGEAIQDLVLSDPQFSPKIEDLYGVARGKTGALFAFCTQAPALIRADTPEALQTALKEIGYLLGLAYQLADDVLDLAGTQENLGKPACNDLRENCMTTPLFRLMQELNMDWQQLRTRYLNNENELSEYFLHSASYKVLKAEIDAVKSQLDRLVDVCRSHDWEIQEIVAYFWGEYVQNRLYSLKDAECH